MTNLFLMLAQSVTGNVITIIALNLVAAAIGFLIAWLYARSVFKPVIKGLENEKVELNKQLAALKDEIIDLNGKIGKLEEKVSALENEITDKIKEIKGLSEKSSPRE
ncbi:MAG: hypothetical protein JXR41_10055 [Bacteroidales bacterium]|nr:hypothetical protein [Bacteroidales bacterium]